jgi:putative phosphoribosyl transferase
MNNHFANREQAGKLLAAKLIKYQRLNPVILALPRGGIPVAYEISSRLKAPLDVVLVKKIGAPGHEEFAIGAIAEDEKPILNQKVIQFYNFKPEDIENIIVDRISEIRSREKLYRKDLPKIPLENRIVIVVDDGLATGATMLAAVNWLRTKNVKKIIVAVPVSSSEAARMVRHKVDEFISLLTPPDMLAIGMWYKDFLQVSDKEVLNILKKQATENQNKSNESNEESNEENREVIIQDGAAILKGVLTMPLGARGIILFAHGGGSSHKSPRNQYVAKALNDAGFATLLFDLLTIDETADRKNVFDIELMTSRLMVATEWAKKINPDLPIGYFGASTGAAAALGAAALRVITGDVFAVVSRGGRPDLALDSLAEVSVPTLLLVGEKDKAVIPLNEYAINKLKNSQLVLIPNATHLFEEPGALVQVVEYAVSWFSSSLIHYTDKTPGVRSTETKDKLVTEIEDCSHSFTTTKKLDSWIREISKHRIIMMGEATHGTKEFYSIKREISKILIQDYGYKFIAVEGDWPDCYKLNEYISGDRFSNSQGSPYVEHFEDARHAVSSQFHRWPTWMWANEEIPPLIEWMKDKQMGAFYGLDVYSLFESLEEIKKHLDHIEPETAQRMLAGYKCFESYKFDEIAYAKSLLQFPKGCQEEVVKNLRALLRLRLYETSLSKESLFDARQNARVIANAEDYYRAMFEGGPRSWNVRDLHMMETLEHLLELYGPDAKVIIWAHNTHIGDYHATDMLDSGYVNLGGLARERYGLENVYLLGFSSYHGSVTAGKAWGGKEEKMFLPKAQKGSYEDYFHQAAMNMHADKLLMRFDKLNKDSNLYKKLGHRAVGVVYDPAHESRGNYVPTKMADRYDAMIFIDETTAVEPLATVFTAEEFPETWPEGQ